MYRIYHARYQKVQWADKKTLRAAYKYIINRYTIDIFIEDATILLLMKFITFVDLCTFLKFLCYIMIKINAHHYQVT